MSRSDALLLALNGLLLAWAFLGFASTDLDTLLVGALLAMATAAVNGAVLIRRRRGGRPSRRDRDRASEADEMDAHRVLDLDARLDALERAQHDAADAARWRALVESGQASAPADLAAEADRRASAVRNGAWASGSHLRARGLVATPIPPLVARHDQVDRRPHRPQRVHDAVRRRRADRAGP